MTLQQSPNNGYLLDKKFVSGYAEATGEEHISMNHPPIPPNCPYFCWVIGGEMAFNFNIESDFDQPGGLIQYIVSNEYEAGSISQEIRGIIAAVARCAWLDRVGEAGGKISEEAEANADAWAKWGKQK